MHRRGGFQQQQQQFNAHQESHQLPTIIAVGTKIELVLFLTPINIDTLFSQSLYRN